jgi:O-antigen ligase
MIAWLKETRFPLETGILAALCVFLPLAEAPKNLLWLAYLATWLVNRARAREFGGDWDPWDTLIALWIASGYLVAAFAGLHKSEWQGAGDLLRYGSILWLVKRAGYGERESKLALTALVAATVVGLLIGYFRLWSGIGKSGTLQLHSVGHVNHTAIYLAIMLGLCAAWAYTRFRVWTAGRRALAAAVLLLVLVSLVVTASRGAIGVGLVMLPLLAAAWRPRWRAPLAASAAAIVLVAGAALLFRFEVVRKQERNVADENVLAFRDGVWRVSLAAFGRYPAFGVGMDNYSQITPERVRTWRGEAGARFAPDTYYFTSHGHSLFANTLAERGAAGSAALGAVLAAWLYALLRHRPRAPDADLYWLLWGGSAAAWFVTVAAGTVNTTLHHEHGILAALLLGLWLPQIRPRRAS